jgi:putative ABC transport system permease protein
MDNYWDQDKWAEVVGVVGEVRQRDLGRDAGPAVYFPLGQRPFRARYGTVVARGPAEAAALLPAFREALQRAAPDVAFRFGTFEETMLGSLGERRFTLRLLLAFALLALGLAALGIYAVVAWAVARRTREMGIRVALGAEPRQARDLLVRGALVPVAAGALAAVVAATALSRPMTSFLYGIGFWNPVVWIAAAGGLLLVAVAASALPARRVLRLDPTRCLRDEGPLAS